MQGEFADLGQQRLLASFKLLGEIARMAAQSLGSLGDEVVPPLIDFGEGERVTARCLCCSGSALKDVDDKGCLALGSPALGTVGVRISLDSRRCDGGFWLIHGERLQIEVGH